MKITKAKLKEIIKEELGEILSLEEDEPRPEACPPCPPCEDYPPEIRDRLKIYKEKGIPATAVQDKITGRWKVKPTIALPRSGKSE